MKTISILSVLVGITGLLLFGGPTGEVLADGTETLGPPSITISQGTDVVAAGVGLAQSQPGNINIEVPAGAAVTQVLLYWEGFMATNVAGDDIITVNGNSVTGTLIGGQAFFFGGAYSSSFRADITSLGLVGPGTNTLTVGDLVFSDVSNGAGVVVIYDDGSGITDIDIRDGLDLAFINFPEPRFTTIAQTFTFISSPVDRVGTLAMFFSSVAGTASGEGPLRPSSIDITVDGTTTTFSNQLNSNDGDEWDTVNASVTIPAGATSLTVQAFSRDDFGDGQDPLAASFVWTAAAFSIQGCSIGDYVWEDADRDGCQDGEEDGINGVTVELYENCEFEGDPITFETITKDGQDGFYEFKNLVCGQQYGIRFVNPSDIYAQTDPNSCPDLGNNDDTKDSDCGDDGRVCATAGDENATPGSDNPTIDCGYVCEGEIGDFVWLDTNGSPGCQDPNEPGIDDVTVNLYKVEGCPEITENTPFFGTTETTNGGEYSFTGLCPGDYRVKFVDPEGRDNTIVNQDCEAFGLPDSGTKDSDCGGDGECVTLPTDDGNVVDDTIDCGKVPPCLLGVEKFCSEPPTAALECTDKIVATTLRYIGPDMDNATVEVDPDKSPTVVYSVDLVSGVTILTMPAENDFTVDARPDENELGAKTKIRINGVEEVIHTSCSTPYVAGLPAPLDNPKGDPSPNWFVVNFEDKDGNFSSVTDPELKEECTVFAADGASCDDGKPISLTFIYTGEDCTASNNEQGDKAKCEGDPADAAPVQLVYVGKNAGKFTVTPAGEAINVGDEVTITTTDKFESNTKLEIRQGGASLQDLEIHTSCSQPLAVGDQFGSLLLSRFVPEGGTAVTENVLYTYRVKNNGPTDVTVKVVDDQLGMIAENLEIPANGQVELTKGALLSETTTNTVRVTDVVDPDCFAEDSVTVTVEEPPTPPCTTKVQAMLLRYTGPSISDATVEFDPDKGPKVTYSNVDLVSGVTILSKPEENGFTIDAKPDENELGAKTKIRINGVEEVIHTSCSTPFVAGAPAPLDNPKGNPSPNWFVEDFVQK